MYLATPDCKKVEAIQISNCRELLKPNTGQNTGIENQVFREYLMIYAYINFLSVYVRSIMMEQSAQKSNGSD